MATRGTVVMKTNSIKKRVVIVSNAVIRSFVFQDANTVNKALQQSTTQHLPLL